MSRVNLQNSNWSYHFRWPLFGPTLPWSELVVLSAQPFLVLTKIKVLAARCSLRSSKSRASFFFSTWWREVKQGAFGLVQGIWMKKSACLSYHMATISCKFHYKDNLNKDMVGHRLGRFETCESMPNDRLISKPHMPHQHAPFMAIPTASHGKANPSHVSDFHVWCKCFFGGPEWKKTLLVCQSLDQHCCFNQGRWEKKTHTRKKTCSLFCPTCVFIILVRPC